MQPTQKDSRSERIVSVEYGSSTVAIGIVRDNPLHHGNEKGLFRLG